MRASNLSGKPLAHEKKNQPIPLREIGRSRFANDAHDLKASADRRLERRIWWWQWNQIRKMVVMPSSFPGYVRWRWLRKSADVSIRNDYRTFTKIREISDRIKEIKSKQTIPIQLERMKRYYCNIDINMLTATVQLSNFVLNIILYQLF